MMISVLVFIAFISIAVIGYIVVGYPLLLLLLRMIRGCRPVNKAPIQPTVTLIISCYNEEAIIREKLENSLSLDYPKDKLDILVVSDASNDRTDEIVKSFADKGVRLIRQEKHFGKTCGLNLAVSEVTSDIIVFSDANSMYDKNAITELVNNFADDQVGYVVGQARYYEKDSPADTSETSYWNYELFLKKLESCVRSVVGGDGAIYAIRRELYNEMLPMEISDFVNPLQIVLHGYRGVFEPNAVCWESAAGSFTKEFNRKVRIVNRSFSGLLRVKSVLNPFRTGLFSILVFSHKLLRWLTPLFLIGFLVPSFILAFYGIAIFQAMSLLTILFLWLAYVGYLLSGWQRVSPIFFFPYYFILVHLASMKGVMRSIRGKVAATWETPRTQKNNLIVSNWFFALIHGSAILSIWVFGTLLGDLIGEYALGDKLVFWVSFLIIFHVYFGYPICLYLLSRWFAKPLQLDGEPITPEVTLLICAYNEEEVIEQKILNSLGLDYPKDKLTIMVASDGSSDRTVEIVKRVANEQVVLMDYPERSGKIGVINKTVPKITSEIIVFSDANTMYNPDAIKKLVRNFKDPSVGAVSSDVILENEQTEFGHSESLYYKYERWIQRMESRLGSIIGADGGMYAIRRELFMPPSDNTILDDFVISMNVAVAGYRLVYDPEAVAYEKSTISNKAEFLRKSRVIAGAIQSIRQHQGIPRQDQKMLLFCYLSHKVMRWIQPIFLLLILVANIRPALAPGFGCYDVAMIWQVMFYGLAVLGMVTNWPVVRTIFYFCMENTAAFYGIYKGVFNKQSVKWKKFAREQSTSSVDADNR